MRYFRAIDGLGRIVLPAELLHHLNWEKGKMSVSIEEKDGCLIVFPSRLQVDPQRLLLLSNSRTARTDNRKSFLCQCLKMKKPPS